MLLNPNNTMLLIPNRTYQVKLYNQPEGDVHQVRYYKLGAIGSHEFICCYDLIGEQKVNFAVDSIEFFIEIDDPKPEIIEVSDDEVDQFIKESFHEDLFADPEHLKITQIDDVISELQKHYKSVEIKGIDAEDCDITKVIIKVSDFSV